MAAASGNAAAVPDRMQLFRGGGGRGSGGGGRGSGGSEAQRHYGQPNQRQWLPDGRDGFLLWLKGEFAAANAIIDSLCHHLRAVGENGEYDAAIGCIQQRRCNWGPVLHMQQYFPVAEVVCALQRAAWQRQHRCFDQVKVGGEKEFRKHGPAFRPRDRSGGVKEYRNPVAPPAAPPAVDVVKGNGEKAAEKQEDGTADPEGEVNVGGNENDAYPKISDSMQGNDQKWEKIPVHKTFISEEMCDGKKENFVEGLRLYENLFDSSEVTNMVSMANNLWNAGQKGAPKGRQIPIIAKRPMRGHGRYTIQLGVPILDRYTEERTVGGFRDLKAEAIPNLLHSIFERLVQLQVVTIKPDFCIIDYFNEGDHSQPISWPSWYGRPVYNLLLTDCDFVFGKTITANHRGDYRGPIKLPLTAGSLLVMQGKSADVAKHAISAARKQRILLRFGKSQSTKPPASEDLTSSTTPTSPWGGQAARSTNNGRQLPVPKQYGLVPTAGVLHRPSSQPQHIAPPIYVVQAPVPPNVAPYISVTQAHVPLIPVSSGWNGSAPPRQVAPRPPPGTGVFLPPPGTGHVTASEQPPLASEADAISKITPVEVPFECKNGIEKSTCDAYSNGRSDAAVCKLESNGSINNDVTGEQVTNKEETEIINSKKKLTSKPSSTDVAAA